MCCQYSCNKAVQIRNSACGVGKLYCTFVAIPSFQIKTPFNGNRIRCPVETDNLVLMVAYRKKIVRGYVWPRQHANPELPKGIVPPMNPASCHVEGNFRITVIGPSLFIKHSVNRNVAWRPLNL